MKKYKHKSTGKIAVETNSGKNYKVSFPRNFTIPKWIIENSNDWEEIIEKDYEILEIRAKKHVKISSVHTWTPEDDSMYSLEDMLFKGCSVESGDYYIHSIKRKSDAKVFTIGDKIEDRGLLYWIIDRFKVVDNTIKLECERNPKTTTSSSLLLNEVSKVKNEILFKTFDGVDIFEGDEVYWVLHHKQDCKILDYKGVCKLHEKLLNVESSFYKTFSIREAAEEYIIMNKPCLSINDICKIPGLNMTNFKKKLKNLVKNGNKK